MPGKSHGQRSLAGFSPWGQKELDVTKWLSMHALLNGEIKCELRNDYWVGNKEVIDYNNRYFQGICENEPVHNWLRRKWVVKK